MDPYAMPQCTPNLPGRIIANIALLAIFTFVVITIVPLRVYTRIWIVKAFWYDDAAIIVATILVLASHGMIWQEHSEGLGKHIQCVPKANMLSIMQRVRPISALSLLSLTFSRISVAILLVRLFSVSKRLKWMLFSVMAVMATFTVVNIALSFEEQIGLQAELVISYVAAAIFAFSDLLLATVPIFILRKVQLKRKQKIAVSILLGLGYITGICAIVRLAALKTNTSLDWTYSPLESMILTEIECIVAITCASIPPLRPLFTRPTKSTSPSGPTPVARNGRSTEDSQKKSHMLTTGVSVPNKSSASLPFVPYQNLSNVTQTPLNSPSSDEQHERDHDRIQRATDREATQIYWDRVNALDATPYFPNDGIMKQVDVEVV